MHSLTKSAASKCEKDDKYRDAVHLHNLAGKHDKVIRILCRKMSQIFSPAYLADVQSSLCNMTWAVYQFYASNQDIAMKVQTRSLETCLFYTSDASAQYRGVDLGVRSKFTKKHMKYII